MDAKLIARNKLFFRAAMAIDANRSDDLIEIIQTLVATVGVLHRHEIELFWNGFKRKTSLQRNAIMIVSYAIKRNTVKSTQLIIDYNQSLKEELIETCTKALNLLDLTLIPHAQTMEIKVNYFRMRGDYYRYQAEVVTDQLLKDVLEEATVSYKKAYEISLNELPPRNVIRLSVALNFSVFYYDILDKSNEAITMAEEAIKTATNAHKCNCEDAKVGEVISFLNDNLESWKKDNDTDVDSEDSD